MTSPTATSHVRLCQTNAPAATILIRLYAGVVFAGEGVLKFLQPQSLGVGRFTTAGIPPPGFFATRPTAAAN